MDFWTVILILVAMSGLMGVDGGINAQQIGRQKNFTYQKERAAGYGSPFLLVF
ncbi:MAG: hypothetical protein SFV17_19355 [Candidatus Obscuribacter sp.]|nr:hypothetical protein [Candidatus Obscuribacter sp.]